MVSSRPVVDAQDKNRALWTVVLDTLNAQTDPRGFAPGHTVCIKNLRPYGVIGRRIAMRIEDPDVIEVCGGGLLFLISD